MHAPTFRPRLEELERRESPTGLGDLVPSGPLNFWVDPWDPWDSKKEDESKILSLVFQSWDPTPKELPDDYYAVADVSLEDGPVIFSSNARGVEIVQVATLSYASPSEWEGRVDPNPPPRLPTFYDVEFYTPGIYAVRDRYEEASEFSRPLLYFIDAPSASDPGGGDSGQVRREGLYQFIAVPGPYDRIVIIDHWLPNQFLAIAARLDPEKTRVVGSVVQFGDVVRQDCIALGRPINLVMIGLRYGFDGVAAGGGQGFTRMDTEGMIRAFGDRARGCVSTMKIITDFLGDTYRGRQDEGHVYPQVVRAVYNGRNSVAVGGYTGPVRVVKGTTGGLYILRSANYREFTLPAVPPFVFSHPIP